MAETARLYKCNINSTKNQKCNRKTANREFAQNNGLKVVEYVSCGMEMTSLY